MKFRKLLVCLWCAISLVILNTGCEEKDEEHAPVIITLPATGITNISAFSGAEIKEKGKYEIIRQGICWSTKPNPTITDNRIKDETDEATFSLAITGLAPKTSYYVRAYAINYIGTWYGNEIEFQTTGEKPVLMTSPILNKTYQSVVCGGMITSSGQDEILSRGVCWSKKPEPTLTNNKTSDGRGTGSFTSTVTNLEVNTSYYIRSYAINHADTTYGDVKTFTLWLNVEDEPLTDVDGNTYPTIRIGDQIWMTENLKVTKMQNGTPLKSLNPASDWADKSSAGYYIMGGRASFGYMYNGYALSEEICPAGWHLPTDTEWRKLVDYLGGFSVAGGKLKESSDKYWITPNLGDNSSGFTAYPAGYVGSDGALHDFMQDASFMSARTDEPGSFTLFTIENFSNGVYINTTSSKVTGGSVRLVKN